MVLHESGENYLETIYILSQKNGFVRSIDIAKSMGFSKPSVSRAVKNLRNDAYISVDEKGYITLTERGHQIGKKISERHQFFSDFLTYIGVDEDIARQDACKIEHTLSVESFRAIKRYLSKVRENECDKS